jgi:uncharacterized protein YfiM (DUF2279 family)
VAHRKVNADFSLTALYEALDEARRARAMTWAAVAREINARFCDVPGHKRISASTIAGLSSKAHVEGDGVLQLLLWLRRTPESFVPGVDDAGAPRHRLRDLGTTQILRWDAVALFEALNARRRASAMSWKDVASEIGGLTPDMLTRLEKGGRTTFPSVMRAVAWLGQPAARFTRAFDWQSATWRGDRWRPKPTLQRMSGDAMHNARLRLRRESDRAVP